MIPKTRQEAIAAGERFYFTGRTCINGHEAQRWAANGECRECLHERQFGQPDSNAVGARIRSRLYSGPYDPLAYDPVAAYMRASERQEVRRLLRAQEGSGWVSRGPLAE